MSDGDSKNKINLSKEGLDDELFLASAEADYRAANKPLDELAKKKMQQSLSRKISEGGLSELPKNKWQKPLLAALVALVIAFIVIRRVEDSGVDTLSPKSIQSNYTANPAKLSVFRVLPSMETEYVALLDLKKPEDIVLQAQSSINGFITVFNWPKTGQNPRVILQDFSLLANEAIFLGSGEDIFIISKEEIELSDKICWIFGVSISSLNVKWSEVLAGESKGGYDCLPTAL